MENQKTTCILLILLSTTAILCAAQTFQYSRGWTNGKRSSAARLREESNIENLYEMRDTDRQLERCLERLRRIIQNPLVIRSATLTARANAIGSNPNPTRNFLNSESVDMGDVGVGVVAAVPNLSSVRHQSNEIFEDLRSVDPVEFNKHD